MVLVWISVVKHDVCIHLMKTYCLISNKDVDVSHIHFLNLLLELWLICKCLSYFFPR